MKLLTYRNLPLFGMAISFLTLSLAGCGGKDEPKAEQAPAKTVRAQTLEVASRASNGTYLAAGTIRTLYNATLSSKVMGRVVRVHVREGDSVKQGQLLVSIDSRELNAATNVASANYNASVIGVASARKAIEIEEKTSRARIGQAESQVSQAEAGVAAAKARYDLVLAGPRTQELSQSRIAVLQAESSLSLAKTELDRVIKLVEYGALARKELDSAQNRYDLAKGQYEAAVQSESMAKEGSRSEEVRGAKEAVAQAEASLRQAKSGLNQAKAAALQIDLRKRDLEAANAQVRQSAAAVEAARVNQSYGQVLAPFDGRIVKRSVDPGAMASPGVELIEIEGGQFQLEAMVPEQVLGYLKVGDSATIQVDALAGKELLGKLTEIVPQGDAMSHNFIAKYAVSAPSGLKSGMFGRATVRTGPTKGITIPATATWQREGLDYVYTVNKDGIARLRIVTLGNKIGDQVEVLSGLSSGDTIVVGNLAEVSDGSRIEGN